MNFLKVFLFAFLLTHLGLAQSSNFSIDFFYQSGRIYVVFVIILVIFAGILAYLIYLDRSIKKLEKKS